MAMEAILARRFAPLNFSVVPGFPNPAPSFSECADFLPIFSRKDEDNPAQHLVKFHQCIDQLDVYHEDALMKMFVYSLDGDARQWYITLPISSISSLKDFHAAFHSYCKRIYPVEHLLNNCCEQFKSLRKKIQEDFSDEINKDSLECSHYASNNFDDHQMLILMKNLLLMIFVKITC
jgi:hypothetical protein